MMIILYSAGFELQLDIIFGIPTSTTFDLFYVLCYHSHAINFDWYALWDFNTDYRDASLTFDFVDSFV